MTKNKLSKVYEEYKKVQEQYPESVIAMRLGDFYEVLGWRALEVESITEVTTLSFPVSGIEEFSELGRLPMVGFPIRLAENYFPKILQKRDVILVEDKDTIRILRGYYEH